VTYPAYPPPTHLAGAAAPPEGCEVDVIILSLDRVEDTIAAIASARAQQGVRKHVWIADQGSAAEGLARLTAAVQGAPDATLVQLDRNWGVAGGRNRATALGRAPVVFALDNDAEFAAPDTLARAAQALQAEPDLAAIGCRILVHATGEEDLSSWGYPASLLPRAAESFEACAFVGAGHALSREWFARCGGYDDALFFCWEEFDFALSAINRGARIRYRGDLAVRHKVSPERRFAWSGTRWFHYVRNRLYIAMKHGTPPLALLPRYAGYQVKGARSGVLAKGLSAGPAALALYRAWRAAGHAPERLNAAAREYLARHDAAHRGGLARRLRAEVLSALPGTARRVAAE
jgi:GT2 family glycosyltransferase